MVESVKEYHLVTLAPMMNLAMGGSLGEKNAYQYLRDMFMSPCFAGFSYLLDGKLAGGCFGLAFKYFPSPTYEIREFFVDVNFHKQGHGSWFMEEIAVKISLMGIRQITLTAVADRFAFYQKNNFEQLKNGGLLYRLLD